MKKTLIVLCFSIILSIPVFRSETQEQFEFDATCKVLKKYENGDVALLSLNPSYQPFYFSKQEVKDTPIQIWGKVKELRAKF